ncbi:MAG: hypothetical protein KIT25_06585 [Enhydrobacter sp.]|nr:MAG: hypothetical protein KIT25_06585 [Enhydrobacter sp.]
MLAIERARRYGFAPVVYDFRNGGLPAGATLARASAGTRINSAGLLVSETTDVPRFTHDPATLALQGLLVEPSDTNAMTQSEDLSAAGWSSGGPPTLVRAANAHDAPDGATTASSLTEDSISGAKFVSRAVAVADGSVYPFSVFAKNIAGDRWVQLTLNQTFGFNFQPSTGTQGSNVGSGTLTGVQIVPFPNGWYRIGGVFTSAVTSGSFGQRTWTLAGDVGIGTPYSGDGAEHVTLWGFHFGSAGNPITSYIACNAASAVTRAADVLTLAVPNGTYTANIERLSGVTTLFEQIVSAGAYTVPTDASPIRRVVLWRTP